MEYNPDKVRTISSEMVAALKRLDDLKGMSKEQFFADPHKIGSAKYSLIVAIEGAIDLSNHVIVKNGFRPPEDYADKAPLTRDSPGRFRKWPVSGTASFTSTGRSITKSFTASSKPAWKTFVNS